MERITLDKQEKSMVSSIIHEYQELDTALNKILDQIAELDKVKDIVLAKIEESRNRETLLMQELQHKYGSGKLDPMTLEYLKTE